MVYFEEIMLTTFSEPPYLWAIYLNDTQTITSQFTNFMNHFKSVHPSIKFMFEIEKNGLIPMLDINICRKEDGSLKCKVYWMEMDHYLLFDSHQLL